MIRTRWPEVGDGEQRTKLDEIVASFSTLEDPRSHINREHPLPSILVIAVLAVLAGAAGPTAIARWAKLKEDLLTGILDLPNGIPGKDVFRRVLMLLKPAAFEAAFNAWIARLRDEATAETGVERPIISLDGKTARRSHDAKNELGPLHVVTAWAGEYGLALGQQVCEEKSNEITAIPELLKKIDVRGGVVTIDAMGTQKAIAEEVIRGKADYVLALKGNQESLHRAVIEHIDERLEGDLEPDRVECRYGQNLLPMRFGLRDVLASPSTTRPDRLLMRLLDPGTGRVLVVELLSLPTPGGLQRSCSFARRQSGPGRT